MNTKLLRQKILDLAIRGKLVPQDPNDEPASVLLEKIRAEKERLIKDKKIKPDKSKNTADRSNYRNEQLFEIPESWEWCKVYNVCISIKNGASIRQNKTSKGIPITRIETISDGTINYDRMGYADIFDIGNFSNYLLQENDILMSHINSPIHVGKTALYLPRDNKEKIIHGMNLLCIRTKSDILPGFLHIFFMSPTFKRLLSPFVKHAVNQASVNISNLNKIPIPLPPLKEQRRIVSEIEKLFTLTDIIEESKLSLEQYIMRTKSKVLDLAIRGKLVTQDPNDEPASVLLERIGKGKKVTSDKTKYPFEVPHGWVWCQLEEISKTLSTKPFQILQSEIQKSGNYPVISQSSNFIEGYSDKEENLFKLKPVIIFGDHTRNVKYVDFEFIVGADGVKILIPQNIYSKYFYYLILKGSEAIENKGYSRHFKFLRSILYPLPPLNEQKRIVSQIETIFAQLDIIEDSLKE